MVVRHGIPSVRDFSQLHETVNRSLTTLRQLGSSKYSTAMRAQLLEWFQIVDGAAAAVDVIQAAQEKWLTQDMVLSSMAFEEEVPLTFQLFQALRYEVSNSECYHKVNNSLMLCPTKYYALKCLKRTFKVSYRKKSCSLP